MDNTQIPAEILQKIEAEYPHQIHRDKPIQQEVANQLTNRLRTAMQKGYQLAQSQMENRWVSVNDRLPEFNTWVLCYCRIYGIYIGSHMQIENTGYGNWHDGKSFGVLPPTHWMPLPESPKQ